MMEKYGKNIEKYGDIWGDIKYRENSDGEMVDMEYIGIEYDV